MDVDNNGNGTTIDIQKNGNWTTIEVDNNRNETTTDVEKNGNWTTIDLDNNGNRTTMKRKRNGLGKWKLVPIIAGLSLTGIRLGVFLAYLLLNENRLCQTDGKLLPPGQTATPPSVLITQTPCDELVSPPLDLTTTKTPPFHHNYNSTTVLSDEKSRRYYVILVSVKRVWCTL
ncbi:hypothetical protein Pcinc_022560 [Petrolisthes cinctipes]|uniref:Uncharacterized protein n=1 Tax=Petrolisthes cinctipes TaxID=88211 RepID=A0AAE1FG35_PETCI|nr:hypothetical protein Pcinc_022560 [Petrolisthes cinctipes]